MSTYADMLKKVKGDIQRSTQQGADFHLGAKESKSHTLGDSLSPLAALGRNDSGSSQGSSYADMLKKVKSDIALGRVTGERIFSQGGNGPLGSANAPLEMTGVGTGASTNGQSGTPVPTVGDLDAEIEKLSAGLENLWTRRKLLYKGDSSGYISPGAQREIAALDAEIEKAERRKTQLEDGKKYSFLSQNADFAEKSGVTATEATAGYLDSVLRNGKWKYDTINGFTRDLAKESRENENPIIAQAMDTVQGNYNYLTPEEKKNFNYLWNTQGEDSAEEYLNYLKKTLSDRAAEHSVDEWKQLSGEYPVQTSVMSVPMNLWGVAGSVDALGQQIKNDITGNYYEPVNYNSAGMMPSKITTAIRGTVAQSLANEYGVIELDEEKHPVLSRVLNGKSLGDVYQLGMSMADSAATAAMTAVLGVDCSALLGGSAATQSMLSAVEKGASDEQALAIGALSGAFEWIFEKYELEHLLGADTNIVKAVANQAMTEALGEGGTSIANMVANALVMAEKSDWQASVDDYLQNNPDMTEEEAKKQAFLDAAISVGWDMTGGALSGGIMGGGTSAIKNVSDTASQPQGAAQSGTNVQSGNGQATQGVAAEPAPWSPEWVKETLELGRGVDVRKKQRQQADGQMLREVIDEVLGVNTSTDNGVAAETPKLADAADESRRLSDADVDDYMRVGERRHVRDAKQRIVDSGESPILTKPEEIVAFIRNAFRRKIQKTVKGYGRVNNRLASAVKTATNGDINIDDYYLELDADKIAHISDHVGQDKDIRNIPLSEEQLEQLPDYIDNYDDLIDIVRRKDGSVRLMLGKKINGHSIILETVSKGRKSLHPVTAYQIDSADYVKYYKTRAVDRSSTSRSANTDTVDISRPATALINNIPQDGKVVNTSAEESVGAATAWFDPNTRLQYEYGTIPEGENPVRSDDLPKKDYTGKDVSRTARTVKGAKVTPDEFVDLLNKETVDGGLSYVKITNDATVQKAIDHISNEGWEAAKAQWQADVHNGKAGADMSAVGALLLNNAAKAGDKTAWLDILHDYQLLGTNTAQGLQALRILKKLAPSDKLYMAKRSVKQMVKDMKLDTDATIDPELETEYNEAETNEQKDAVLKKIQKNVAQQLPTTFVEKFTALRYVNMLGNLRTQGRNIVGNLTMKGTRAIHNTVAAGIEAVANKVSGGKTGRTRSATVSKAQKAAAAKDFESLKDHILDGGKYSDNMTATGFARGVQEQKQIFKFKPLESYRKVTNWAMEQGDLIFAKDAYARALAGYLKANGIAETDYSKVDTAIMDDARLFAAKEAQEATFRDTNWLSGWVSKIGRRKDTPAAGKLLSEGIMPFRKTPANVLVRAEEYSPLGVINSVVLSVQAAQKGPDVTANQVINSWAKTLTGTGLFGMGMLLHSLGLLSVGPDDDEKKDGFEALNGWQDYALTLPDGTNLTIDCFSPSAIPVLMGAQLMKEIRDGGFELKDIGSALTSIADPMVEMSMLQGVNDALENIQYADSNLGQFVINAATGYLTQVLTNTLAGQLERSFEDSRMQTYVDKDSDLPTWLQRTLGKASAKTPVWDYNQIPYINAWGEEEKNPPTGLNAVYNLLSPIYFDKGKDDELTRELNRLNDAQSDINVYPSTPDKTLTVNEQDYNLSAEEYVALAKLQGQTQKQLTQDLIASRDYKALSDEDKAKAIRYAYDYARDSARGEVVPKHPGVTTKWMKEIKGDVAGGIIRHIATDGKYTSLSVSDASYLVDLVANLKPEQGRTNVRDVQEVEAIAGSRLTEAQQKAALRDTLDDNLYEKYLEVLGLKDVRGENLDTDDYADSYRAYLEEKEIGGKGTKARTIKQFQQDFGLSYDVAKQLYEIYG